MRSSNTSRCHRSLRRGRASHCHGTRPAASMRTSRTSTYKKTDTPSWCTLQETSRSVVSRNCPTEMHSHPRATTTRRSRSQTMSIAGLCQPTTSISDVETILSSWRNVKLRRNIEIEFSRRRHAEWKPDSLGVKSQISWFIFLCNSGMLDMTEALRKFYGSFNNLMSIIGKHINGCCSSC